MEAHVKTVREILHSGDQFLVPFFQRHYSWRKEHWQRLFSDLAALLENRMKPSTSWGPWCARPFTQCLVR